MPRGLAVRRPFPVLAGLASAGGPDDADDPAGDRPGRPDRPDRVGRRLPVLACGQGDTVIPKPCGA